MEIAALTGWYSIVLARHPITKMADPSRVMIRARLRNHLERLVDRFQEDLGGADIIETVNADFRFRVIVTKETWIQVAAMMAADVSYIDLRTGIEHLQGRSADDYLEALSQTWKVVRSLQSRFGPDGPLGGSLKSWQ